MPDYFISIDAGSVHKKFDPSFEAAVKHAQGFLPAYDNASRVAICQVVGYVERDEPQFTVTRAYQS